MRTARMDTHGSIASVLLAALVPLALAPLALARADVPPGQVAEVEHLLTFIRESRCELVRNGRRYEGERAHRHVMRKYDYFRDEIATTEDFIAFAATKSELSGNPYLFVCEGVEKDSANVLVEELERFRSEAHD